MFRAAFALVIAAVARAQTPSPETQALQALVMELRQLRQDLQATTVASQRVQIVLYRVQVQTALVNSAASRLEDARTLLGKAQSDKRTTADRIPQLEEHLKSIQDPKERKDAEDMLPGYKTQLERLTIDEQRLQSREIDASAQLRTEQSKLADLQDQLDRLDKLLDSFTRKQP